MARNTKMAIISLLLFIIALFIYRSLHHQLNPTPNTGLPNITANIANIPYTLEVAKTDSQRAAGLSNRTFLCPNCGMIFVFSRQSIYPFWMKDTLIPLDMIWLNSAGKIVTIKTALPQPNTPLTQLTLYQNDQPALYVIELNAGDAQKNNLKIGDIIKLPSLP